MYNLQEIVKSEKKTFIDVRSEQEFTSGHIEGAINVPLHEIRLKMEDIEQMEKPLVIYCLSGGRSSAAVGFLRQAGIEEVYNGGGIGDMQYMLSSIAV
ncbi:MAG: rhodanese-like domain-containing protein [Sphingobacteriales bacterium]|jgi:phage shock protein E|nr:rhodanese-like domain-containing protein [Sphingobacteriales bacterium]